MEKGSKKTGEVVIHSQIGLTSYFSSEITNQGTKVTIRGTITEEQVKKNFLSCAPKLER